MRTFKYILVVLLSCVLYVDSVAQFPKFEWRLENEKLTSPNTYQFDVYLYNIDTFDFELRAGTIAFFVNPLWRNGGTISCTQLSSELVPSQQNNIILYITQTASNPEYWRNPITNGAFGLSTKIPAGMRVKLYTYLFNNTVPFSIVEPPKFAWKFNTSPGAGFNYSTSNGAQVQVVSNNTNTGNPTVEANQAKCYTPSYWNGTNWVTKSQKTGADTPAVLDKYHEVTIYNGTFTGKLNIRGYNLFPTCSHNLNTNDTLSSRADFYNLGTLNASNGSIQFNGNDIPGTERSQYTINPISSKNLIVKNPYHLYLGANANILNKLSFSKGKIIVGNNNLVLEANASSMGENDSAYVVADSIGKLIHKNVGNIGKSGVITFPIGTFMDYNPVYMQNLCANNDFSMSIKKEVKDSAGNSINNFTVNKTWEIKELLNTGSRLNLKFEWKLSDELNSFVRSNSYISCKNQLGKWHTNTSSSAKGLNPYTQEVFDYKSLNNYSEFAIGSSGIIKNGNIDTTTKVSIKNLTLPIDTATINTNNVIIYRIKIPISCTTPGMNLQSLIFKTTGTYKASDISNFKVWYHTDSTFTNGSPIQIASKTIGLDTGIHIFPGLTQYLISGNNYIFLTSDVLCSAKNKTIGSSCEVILLNTSQQVDKAFTTSTIYIQSKSDSIIEPNKNIGIYTYTNYLYSVPFNSNASYHWTVNNGNITSGQGTNQISIQWPSAGMGSVQVEIIWSALCVDTLKTSVSITNNPNCIQISNSLAPEINPKKGSKNVVLTRVNISIFCNPDVLNGLKFKSSGSYTSNDIENYKIWYHSDSVFTNGTPLLLYTKTTGLDTNSYNISGLSKIMSIGNHYLFITTDIACNAQSKRISILVKELSFDNNPTNNTSYILSSVDINNQSNIGSITGPTINVFNNVIYNYSVELIANTNYTWSVTNGTILNGQGSNLISVEWHNNLQGSIEVIGDNQFGCIDTSFQTVSIIYNPACISITGATAPQIFPNRGTNNVILYRLDFNVTCNPTVLNGIKFRPSGSFVAGDINNYKIWYHNNSSFTIGNPNLLQTKTSNLDSMVQLFSTLNQNLTLGRHYIFITTDIPCSTKNKTLTIDSIVNTDIFLSTGLANCIGMLPSSITINPSYSAPIISGVSNNADTLFTYIYSIPNQGNSTYLWRVLGGNIISGQGTNTINVLWTNSGKGKVLVEITNQQLCVDTSMLEIGILNLFNYIHISNDTASINRPRSGSKNILLYKINTSITKSAVYLKSVQFKLEGNFNSYDIDNLKLWYHNSSDFKSGTPLLLNNRNNNIDTGYYSFLNLNTLFNVGDNYLFLTADLPCSAQADSIMVKSIELSDIIFTSGIKTGSNFTNSRLLIDNNNRLDSIIGPKDNLNTSIIYTYSINNGSNADLHWNIINGNILSGQGTNEITVNWLNTGIGKISVWQSNNCTDTSYLIVNVPSNLRCISLSNASTKQPSAGRGSRNTVLYRVNIDLACASAILNSAQFNTSGNYTASDISNFKLWLHSDSNFSVGSPLLLSTKTSNLETGIQKFNGLHQSLTTGRSYLFFTMDLGCSVNNGFINVNTMSSSDISFQSNVGYGTNYTSSMLNIISDTLVGDIHGEFIKVIDNISYNYSVDFRPSTSYIWNVENGSIISGQGSNGIEVIWTKEGTGKVKVTAYNQQLCSDSNIKTVQVQSFVPLVKLSNSDPQTIIPSKGATNIIIYKINLNVQRLATVLTGINFTTIGTYRTEDLNNMKIWYHNNSSFNTGTPQLLGTKTINIDPGLINYQGFNKNLDTGMHYIFISIDIPCKANNKVISVSPINIKSVSFSNAVVVGNNFTTKPVTINPLPVVSNISGQKVNLKTNNIYNYSVTQLSNISYIWSATNGDITSGQGTFSADIKWSSLGNGTITLIGTNTYNCIDTTTLDVVISENSGIEDEFLFDKINIYPNPNNGQFTIQTFLNKNQETSMHLYNLLGQVVWQENQVLESGLQEIKMNTHLNTGVYMLKISTNTSQVTKTILIQ